MLGTEREGSGVVISTDGLVLTIGYLILEARNSALIPRLRALARTEAAAQAPGAADLTTIQAITTPAIVF